MKTKEELAKEFEESKKWMEGGPKLWVQRTFIAGHEAAQRWINVNDGLPEKYQYIFVLSSVGDAYVTMYDGRSFVSVAPHPVNITHWLPIPKLPTE